MRNLVRREFSGPLYSDGVPRYLFDGPGGRGRINPAHRWALIRKKMNRTEKELEAACTRYARERGWISIKLENTGHTGIPDRLFLKDGRAIFVEFKTPGIGRLSIFQSHWLERLNRERFTARTIWSEEDFKELIK